MTTAADSAAAGSAAAAGLGAASSSPPLLSAAELWGEIVARTDEVYEVAEEAAPRFEAAVRALFLLTLT